MNSIEEKFKKVEELRQKGYEPVWIHNAEPNEEDPDHTHSYDTHLIILDGEIEIKMDGKNIILKTGDEIDIPLDKVHSAEVGENGCEYIVAEKH